MKKVTTIAMLSLAILGISCQKSIVAKQPTTSLVLDVRTNNAYKAVPVNTSYIGLYKTNAGVYAVSQQQDRCSSHALWLSSEGEVCNRNNVSIGNNTIIQRSYATNDALYYVTQREDTVRFYKKTLPSGTPQLLQKFQYNNIETMGVVDIRVINTTLYFIFTESNGSYALKSFSLQDPFQIKVLYTERPELYYARLFQYRNQICMLGGYKAGYPEKRIVDEHGAMLWHVTAEDSRRFVEFTEAGTYMTEVDAPGNAIAFGLQPVSGAYQRLYEVGNTVPNRGSSVVNVFETSKGLLILLQANGTPFIKDLASGKTMEGTMFLRVKDGSLIHVSDEILISGEATIYAAEDTDGIWFANLFTEYGSGSQTTNNIQHMIWK